MNRWPKLAVALLCTALVSPVLTERAQRPMQIHKVSELGLEIWTEAQPEWTTELVHQGKKPIFIVQSPPKAYPPAAMSYVSFPGMRVEAGELKAIATSALRQAARNYRVPQADIDKLRPAAATYSELTGYEAVFSGSANGEAVDVKVFVGHKPGKGPVTLQVYTFRDKLPHLSEQIRRAWQNVKYLD